MRLVQIWGKALSITTTTTNRALSAIFKGLGVFSETVKSLQFRFETKKENNAKRFRYLSGEK